MRKLGRSIARLIRQLGLFTASALVLLLGLIITAGLWIGLTRWLNHHWPWYGPLARGEKLTSSIDLTKLALAVVAGVGAAIGLTVTYRRQRDLERGRFDQRFAAAAAQLAADTAAQRLAGVYAVGALADENQTRRQQCIDLLCAYIRLPYDPAAGPLQTVVSEHSWPVGAATGREQRTYEPLPNDRDARLAIIALIAGHLQSEAKTSWSKYDYDFSGALFDGGSFRYAEFSGRINFDSATFSGDVDFFATSFSGRIVSFHGATFAGDRVNFSWADFMGFAVFNDAKFPAGGVADFESATFAGGTSFGGAAFSGGRVNTYGVEFYENVNFSRATFSGGHVSLIDTLFDADVNFNGATFSGGHVSLNRSRFAGGQVTFDDATFSGGRVTFDEATFDSGSRVTRDGSNFTGYEPPEAP
jgi:uncharacterized protein YjbI with pentapeptide repeats